MKMKGLIRRDQRITTQFYSDSLEDSDKEAPTSSDREEKECNTLLKLPSKSIFSVRRNLQSVISQQSGVTGDTKEDSHNSDRLRYILTSESDPLSTPMNIL